MIRKAFRMRVYTDQWEEYTRRHNPIWPELAAVLLEHGVHYYSIFLDPETSFLFAYVLLDSEERWEAIATTPVCQRWWAYMRELMHTHADGRPQTTALVEVFHLPLPEVPS